MLLGQLRTIFYYTYSYITVTTNEGASMIPNDKFGNKLYAKTFNILKENGCILSGLGYKESKNSPNLFFLRTSVFSFYADMRGTKEISIWSDTCPFFYWEFHRSIPKWEKRRVIKKELIKLFNSQCPCRLSFYLYREPEFEDIPTYVDVANGEYDWDDGRCEVCKKDFKGEGRFCSRKCKGEYEKAQIDECLVCGKEVYSYDEYDSNEALEVKCIICNEKMCLHNSIDHHISYFPEKTVPVHRGCHC
ncbi:MAG: hypothetical protein GY834_17110 [Bacteroidetes bacterium]|nr:hypothetical protein [Bacteroidota bacterium]